MAGQHGAPLLYYSSFPGPPADPATARAWNDGVAEAGFGQAGARRLGRRLLERP